MGKCIFLPALLFTTFGIGYSQNYLFNDLNANMGNLSELSNTQSRSVSSENYKGEKEGMAGTVHGKDVRNEINT